MAFPVVFDVDYGRMIELIDGLDELENFANVVARFKPDWLDPVDPAVGLVPGRDEIPRLATSN